MNMKLSEYTVNRDNNFNLLRFIAAFLVLYTHSFSLISGNINDEPMRTALGMSFGDMAVDIFFVTSGFLITSSYINRGNLIAFAWARVLRIYPGLIFAMFLSVFVIGFWLTELSILEYLTHTDIYKYFAINSTLLLGIEYTLPGVFQEVPFSNVVNGSLWTLPFEVKMYAILALILMVASFLSRKTTLLTHKNMLFLFGVFSLLLLIINHFYPIREGSVFVRDFIRLFTAFFIGAMFYVWKDNIILSYKIFFILIFLLCISSIDTSIFFITYNLTLAYIIFFIAYVPKGSIRKFNAIGDYSYGMYIYAFPIQQALVFNYPSISVVNMVIFSFIATLILAIVSWHLIEKRFLKMKNNYRFIEKIFKKASI